MTWRQLVTCLFLITVSAASSTVGSYFAFRQCLNNAAAEFAATPDATANVPASFETDATPPRLMVGLPRVIDATVEQAGAGEFAQPAALPRVSRPPAELLGTLDITMAQVRAAQDVILCNMANAGTVGFKRSRLLFEEVAPLHIRSSGQFDQEGRLTAVGSASGGGVRVAARQIDMSQGRLRPTNQPLDLAIEGDGFFQINDGQRVFYARAGSFNLNANGELVLVATGRSRLLEPAITVPQDATEIVISPQGIVSVLQAGQSQLTQIGQLQLARFVNPIGLMPHGENLYRDTIASGTPLASTPGDDGLGVVRQFHLEESNVSLPVESADLRRLQQLLATLEEAEATLGTTTRHR